MARDSRLTHITALILQAIDSGFVYGFSIMEMAGLPSGTIYPAMRRMEEDQLDTLSLGKAGYRRSRAEATPGSICVPYQEFLAYGNEITRVKFRLASPRAARWFGALSRAGCEWRALTLSTSREEDFAGGC